MHYLLFYDLPPGYLEKREKFRKAHLDLVRKNYESGELLMAGALSDPYDLAILVFKRAESAEKFVTVDPYVKKGLIKTWRIRKWNTVTGEEITLH